jgi:hypothetical protein
MENKPTNPTDDQLDQAVAARLRKLQAMPLDLSKLQSAVGHEIPKPQPAQAPRPIAWFTRPLRIAAAFLLVSGLIAAIIFSASPSTALASPQTLAAMHQSMAAMPAVDSIDAATAALRTKWPAAADMPPGDDHASMACCIHKIGRKNAALVAMNVDNAAVTMAVAKASDVKIEEAAPSLTRDGVTYRVQSSGDLNMVMTQRQDVWLCVMGKLPIDRLIRLSSEMKL